MRATIEDRVHNIPLVLKTFFLVVKKISSFVNLDLSGLLRSLDECQPLSHWNFSDSNLFRNSIFDIRVSGLSGSGCLRMNCTDRISPRLFSLIFLLLFLPAGQPFASGAELTNIVVKNDGEDLFIDLMFQGVFTNEMKKALLSGIPVSFAFIVILYKVNDFWFDKKVASATTNHKIQYDASKNDYRITRSWEKKAPLVVKDFDEAGLLMSQIGSLKIVPFTKLKKGEHYQLRVKSELNETEFPFAVFPWEFETDWYTLNFIY